MNNDRAQEIRREFIQKLAELKQKQDDVIERFVGEVKERKMEEIRKSLE